MTGPISYINFGFPLNWGAISFTQAGMIIARCITKAIKGAKTVAKDNENAKQAIEKPQNSVLIPEDPKNNGTLDLEI